MLATRLPVIGIPETVYLEAPWECRRSALCAHLRLACGEVVRVYGTHFNQYDHTPEPEWDGIRCREAETLLRHHAEQSEACAATLVAADWNQQRKCDYSDSEWALIAASMMEREEPEDDGVATCFEEQGFSRSLDLVRECHVDCNWNPQGLPPPTHWTSTAIDYSFVQGLMLRGAYVVQSVMSDHLPVVCDWQLP